MFLCPRLIVELEKSWKKIVKVHEVGYKIDSTTTVWTADYVNFFFFVLFFVFYMKKVQVGLLSKTNKRTLYLFGTLEYTVYLEYRKKRVSRKKMLLEKCYNTNFENWDYPVLPCYLEK